MRERGIGKNDHIDAIAAARGSLHKRLDQLADARAGQTSATLHILLTLLTARDAMTSERTRAINALNALLRTHALGIDARKKVNRPTIRVIAAWRARTSDTLALATARTEAIRLATRVLALDVEVDANEQTLLELVTDTHPALLDLPGVGPTTAAVVLAAWSHPRPSPRRGRVRETRRRQPARGRLRQPTRTPSQPHRRPAAQPRSPHHRQLSHATRRTHPRLRRPPYRTRTRQAQSPTLSHALHRPRALPPLRRTGG